MSVLLSFRTSLVCAALSTAALAGMATAAQAQKTSYQDVTSTLAVDANTEVPGHVLKPGEYSIRVVDSLKDRYILQVEDTRGNHIATFIGLRDPQLGRSDAKGTILWSNSPGKKSALRGFSFANGLTVEFVYPKAEAVELAKLNTNSVPAIDPESEGRKADPKLSDEDRQVVTLWMLQATRVGPGKGTPAIAAKQFHAEPETEVAQNTAPPALPTKTPARGDVKANSNATLQPVASTAVGAKTVDAKTKGRTLVAARLPQTASQLPLLFLVSGLLLGTGFGVGSTRRMQGTRQQESESD